MRRIGWACVLVLAGVLAGGCSSDSEPTPAAPSVSVTPTPEPTPTPTVEPTPGATPADLSDAQVGIAFVDIPDVTGPAAAVHDALAIFMKEFWRSLTTGTVSPLLEGLVSDDVRRRVVTSVDTNAAGNHLMGGTLRVSISSVHVDGDSASAVVCSDYSDVVVTEADRSNPQSAEESGLVSGTANVTLTRIGEDRWFLSTYERGEPC